MYLQTRDFQRTPEHICKTTYVDVTICTYEWNSPINCYELLKDEESGDLIVGMNRLVWFTSESQFTAWVTVWIKLAIREINNWQDFRGQRFPILWICIRNFRINKSGDYVVSSVSPTRHMLTDCRRCMSSYSGDICITLSSVYNRIMILFIITIIIINVYIFINVYIMRNAAL